MDPIAKAATVCAIAGGTYAIFKALEETSSVASKTVLSSWLRGTKLSENRKERLYSVVEVFITATFGHNPFSAKFLRRSLLVSLFAAPFAIGVLYALAQALNSSYFQNAIVSKLVDPGSFLIASIPYALFSFLSDYISLVKSSIIVQSAHFKTNPVKFFALDICMSLLLAGGWIFVFAMSVITYGSLVKDFGMLDAWSKSQTWIVAIAISALFPTILGLTLALSGVVAKVMVFVARPFDYLKDKLLDIEGKPFQSMGVLLVLPTALASSLMLLVL